MKGTKGYKVFNSDWTCRDFKYEVGKTYEIDGEISLCEKGVHFCQKASDCFKYYSFDNKNKVAEIEADGEVMHETDKSVCSKITIVREIPWHELLTIVNEGKYNTGLNNTGNRNTGNWNTGNRNTGDWNATNDSSGVFCTEEQKILIFDKQSNITLSEWRDTEAYWLLRRIETVFWVYSSDMTDQEKKIHPEHKVTGGFLRTVNMFEAAEKWWSALDERERNIIKSIPNFDSEKFKAITGLSV